MIEYPIYVEYNIDPAELNPELQLRLEQAKAIMLLFDTRPDVNDVPDYSTVDLLSRVHTAIWIGDMPEEIHGEIANEIAERLSGDYDYKLIDYKDLPRLN